MRQSRDETLEALNPLLFGAAAVATLLAGAWLGTSRRRRPSDFRNKAVLITGGSRGLGLELARVFARNGANLALMARNTPTLEAARQELEKTAPRVLTLTGDVRRQQDIQRAVDDTIRQFGALDVLVNNAGVMLVGPFDSMTIDDYRDAMDTHAWASLHSTMAAVPHMRRNGGGHIINIISIGGKLGVPHMVPYVMSKFAQAGLSEALGAELAKDNIHVTSVYPGLMRTGSPRECLL
jgi:NAD(P)-dependent dehydrogenase (short-subunit alcohol dehydrogenase family)